MKEKLIVFTLILCLSLSLYTQATLGGPCVPGVVEGDFFYYEMYGVFTSSTSGAVIEVPEYERNNTDWVRIDITGVSGSVVHQVYTMNFKGENGTFELNTDLNPSTAGNISVSELGIPICAANLEVGDTLLTVELRVKDTSIRAYPSGNRETNHVSWNSTLDYGDCYFDKKTGMLVELNRTHLYVDPVTDEVINKVDIVKMTNSSFWSASNSPKTLLPPPIIVVGLVGVFLFAPVCYRHYKKRYKVTTASDRKYAPTNTVYLLLL